MRLSVAMKHLGFSRSRLTHPSNKKLQYCWTRGEGGKFRVVAQTDGRVKIRELEE